MSGPKDKDADGGQTVFLVGFLGLLCAVVMWALWGNSIMYGLLQVARWLMIPPRWIAEWLSADYIGRYNLVAAHLNSVSAPTFTVPNAGIVYSFLSRTYYFVLLPVVALLAVWLWRRPVALRHTGDITLWNLIERNKRYYPQIRPAFFHKLLEEDPDEGPFARALDYRGFAERHHLLLDDAGRPAPWRSWYADADDPSTYDGGETGDPSKPRVPVPYPAASLDGPKARTVFAEQLGPLWAGHADLPLFLRALFGVLVARVARDIAGSDSALFQMNATWTEKRNGKHKMDCRQALQLADRHHDAFAANHLYKKHAYRHTLFSALLKEAQDRSGSFPTSMFLWLKVVDRTLFYSLNQVGRPVAWPEAAGVRSHLLGEKGRGHRIDRPVVEPAVRSMAAHLAKESYLHVSQKIGEPRAGNNDFSSDPDSHESPHHSTEVSHA